MLNQRNGTASVVFYNKENNGKREMNVLIGKETKFLSNYKEKLAECFGLDVIKIETIDPMTRDISATIKREIRNHFSQEARTLTHFLNRSANSAYLNSRIHNEEYKIDFPIFVVYDEPVIIEKNTVKLVKVNYRFLSRGYSYGVVKGGIEGAETAVEAACREIHEELNLRVDPRDLLPLKTPTTKTLENHHIFAYCVKDTESLIRVADSMICNEHRGELVELGFSPLSEILARCQDIRGIRGRLNQKSLEALKEFAAHHISLKLKLKNRK
jgi:8-oxo-dGTP pyrophosphatase MutT (NUDIX family)